LKLQGSKCKRATFFISKRRRFERDVVHLLLLQVSDRFCSNGGRNIAAVNHRPLGALMVANRWPTARYQPADALYKPSSTEEEEVGERVIKKQRRERRKKPETQRHQLHF